MGLGNYTPNPIKKRNKDVPSTISNKETFEH